MEKTHTRHPALAFLVSLSVAGTCLAAPGLAFAAPAAPAADPAPEEAVAVDEVAASDAADKADADKVAKDETTEPAEGTDEAAISNPALKGAQEAAADADKVDTAERADDKAGRDTKDIKVDSGTLSFGDVSVKLPDSFVSMEFPGSMAIAVAPTGDMSVIVAGPTAVGADAGEAAKPELFDSVVAALAKEAGVEAPQVQKLSLADGTAAYEYVFDLVDSATGEAVASNDEVYLVFVPTQDSFAVVQVTVGPLVADVAGETVDSILSSIQVGEKAADTDDAAEVTDATKVADADNAADTAKAADAADTAQDADTVEPQEAVDTAAISDEALKGAQEAAEDADEGDETERADEAKADEQTPAAADADADEQAPAAAGTEESFGGLVFQLPEGFSAAEGSSEEQAVWEDADGTFVVRVTPNVAEDAAALTHEDLDMLAFQQMAALGGMPMGGGVYENDGATVYAYAVAFERDGEELMGVLGFVPVAGGSLSVLSCAFPLAELDTYAPLFESVIESVGLAE